MREGNNGWQRGDMDDRLYGEDDLQCLELVIRPTISLGVGNRGLVWLKGWGNNWEWIIGKEHLRLLKKNDPTNFSCRFY